MRLVNISLLFVTRIAFGISSKTSNKTDTCLDETIDTARYLLGVWSNTHYHTIYSIHWLWNTSEVAGWKEFSHEFSCMSIDL